MKQLLHNVRNLKVLTEKEIQKIEKLSESDKMILIKEYNNSIKFLIENLGL